jgi:hypothetical protein
VVVIAAVFIVLVCKPRAIIILLAFLLAGLRAEHLLIHCHGAAESEFRAVQTGAQLV